jgi:predicted aspartyl protease
MKIRGYFDLLGRARVKARIVCQKPQVNEEVKFLVDTGASRTVLAERDTAKLGINYEDLMRIKLRQSSQS